MSVEVNLIENRVEYYVQSTATYVYKDYNSNDYSFAKFHSHRQHEICICTTPSAIVFCGSEIRRIGGVFATFYPANITHLQLNHPHSLYRRFYVRFPDDFAEDYKEEIRKGFFCVTLESEDVETLNTVSDMLLRIDKDEDNEWKKAKQKHLIELIWDVLLKRRGEYPADNNLPSKKEQRIYEACSYIQSHYKEKLTINSIAQMLFLSRATIDRQFRNFMKMSIADYINNVRCSYAIEYLKKGKSVKEAADEAGFSDQSYFIKVFKKYYGITPYKFTLKLKAENNAGN